MSFLQPPFWAIGSPAWSNHFGLTLTTDAAAEPITLADAKLWLRIDDSASDTDVAALILAARKKVEADTSLALINQTITMTRDTPPYGRRPWLLPIGPVSAIGSIKSYAADDTESTVDSSVYRLDTSSMPARIVLKEGQSWPTSLRPENGLAAVFTAGFGASAANVPANLIMAMRLLIENWFANRGVAVVGALSMELQQGYESLIGPMRLPGLA